MYRDKRCRLEWHDVENTHYKQNYTLSYQKQSNFLRESWI